MRAVRYWFCIALLAGCTSAPVSESGNYLGDPEPPPPEACEPVRTQPIKVISDLTDVGTMTVENDESSITVSGEGSGGWEFTRFDLFVRTDSFQDLFFNNYDPSSPTASMTFSLADLGIGCGDEFKIYLNGDMTDGETTVQVSALGIFEWPDNGGWFQFYEVCCPEEPPSEGCTLTQGFWKNHPDAWPVDSLILGSQAYSAEELMDLLNTRPRGDASIILAHQLIAALLNAASGASFDELIAEAQAWMSDNADGDGRLPYGVRASSEAGGEATYLSEGLASYNEGEIGPGHCDD